MYTADGGGTTHLILSHTIWFMGNCNTHIQSPTAAATFIRFSFLLIPVCCRCLMMINTNPYKADWLINKLAAAFVYNTTAANAKHTDGKLTQPIVFILQLWRHNILHLRHKRISVMHYRIEYDCILYVWYIYMLAAKDAEREYSTARKTGKRRQLQVTTPTCF